MAVSGVSNRTVWGRERFAPKAALPYRAGRLAVVVRYHAYAAVAEALRNPLHPQSATPSDRSGGTRFLAKASNPSTPPPSPVPFSFLSALISISFDSSFHYSTSSSPAFELDGSPFLCLVSLCCSTDSVTLFRSISLLRPPSFPSLLIPFVLSVLTKLTYRARGLQLNTSPLSLIIL